MIRILLLGLLVFVLTFFVWRKMRADYRDEDVLTVINLMIFGGMLGGVLGSNLFVQWRGAWWGVVFAGVFLIYKYSSRKNWDVWEWADIFTRIGLWLSFGVSLLNLSANWVLAIGSLIGIIMTGILSKTYRRIRWYKSGKMGFLACVGIILWSISVIVSEIVNPYADTNWLGLSVDQWVGTWVLTISLVALYFRSGRLTDDLKAIWPKTKRTKA